MLGWVGGEGGWWGVGGGGGGGGVGEMWRRLGVGGWGWVGVWGGMGSGGDTLFGALHWCHFSKFVEVVVNWIG